MAEEYQRLLRLLEKLPQGPQPCEVITCSQDMKFVWIGPGTFLMGSPSDEAGRSEDETQHRVTLTRGFWLGMQPVTQAQWQAVMGDNPSYFSRFGGGRLQVKDISDEELKLFPVESVSWDDAQVFIKKLSVKERGRGYVYRLPSEAEWEYACRGGAT